MWTFLDSMIFYSLIFNTEHLDSITEVPPFMTFLIIILFLEDINFCLKASLDKDSRMGEVLKRGYDRCQMHH